MGKNIILILTTTLLLLSCNGQNNRIDKTVVKELNLEKYLGTWYEIARYPHSFEKGLVGVTATYSMRKDGKIKVVNKGFKNRLTGKESISIGKAKIPNQNEPAKLKVSFFWFFYGDYFVMELDENYQWAVVGSDSNKYLWILSRTPQMKDETYKMLLNRIKARGYSSDKLIKVEQKK